jgi:hypothetical protein
MKQNEKLNESRQEHNTRVNKLKGLGSTKGVKWREVRRNRSI